MAGKADFAADEWSLLCKSPMLAGMVVVAASPSGPFGVIKEMVAMGRRRYATPPPPSVFRRLDVRHDAGARATAPASGRGHDRAS